MFTIWPLAVNVQEYFFQRTLLHVPRQSLANASVDSLAGQALRRAILPAGRADQNP
jgi:hypothetical protein